MPRQPLKPHNPLRYPDWQEQRSEPPAALPATPIDVEADDIAQQYLDPVARRATALVRHRYGLTNDPSSISRWQPHMQREALKLYRLLKQGEQVPSQYFPQQQSGPSTYKPDLGLRTTPWG
jgi:hypothetical protein